MTDPSLAVQKALRALLVARPAVVAVVPAANVIDRTIRPEVFPCIIIGDGQSVLESASYPRRHVRVFSDLHLWCEEDGLASVKALAGAVNGALANVSMALDGCRALDSRVASTRYLRDPSGRHGHAVMSFETLVELPL